MCAQFSQLLTSTELDMPLNQSGNYGSKELTVGFERGGKYNQLIRYQYKDNM